MPRVRIAIGTTLRDAGHILDSFVAYHLGVGFSHLFLFFDDPSDVCLARVSDHPKITTIATDDGLHRRWSKLPEYQVYGKLIGREVMARQILNIALTMEMARDKGCDWLLHIDVDELFFVPKRTVMEHFVSVQARAADTIRYRNFEAVPERVDITDPFREVDLFKTPPDMRQTPITEAGRTLLANTPQIPPKGFHFYRNGKAAVRVKSGLRPNGVHRFKEWGGTTREDEALDAFVLHYPCCGFDSFWKKYTTLGTFADTWFGALDIRSSIGSLHLDSRDIVAAGDRETAHGFYRTRIAIENPEIVELLIRERVLARLAQPRELLNRLRA